MIAIIPPTNSAWRERVRNAVETVLELKAHGLSETETAVAALLLKIEQGNDELIAAIHDLTAELQVANERGCHR